VFSDPIFGFVSGRRDSSALRSVHIIHLILYHLISSHPVSSELNRTEQRTVSISVSVQFILAEMR